MGSNYLELRKNGDIDGAKKALEEAIEKGDPIALKHKDFAKCHGGFGYYADESDLNFVFTILSIDMIRTLLLQQCDTVDLYHAYTSQYEGVIEAEKRIFEYYAAEQGCACACYIMSENPRIDMPHRQAYLNVAVKQKHRIAMMKMGTHLIKSDSIKGATLLAKSNAGETIYERIRKARAYDFISSEMYIYGKYIHRGRIKYGGINADWARLIYTKTNYWTKRAVLCWMWFCRQYVCKDVGLIIAKLVWESRCYYPDEWSVL
jgi:hypothetical protein